MKKIKTSQLYTPSTVNELVSQVTNTTTAQKVESVETAEAVMPKTKKVGKGEKPEKVEKVEKVEKPKKIRNVTKPQGRPVAFKDDEKRINFNTMIRVSFVERIRKDAFDKKVTNATIIDNILKTFYAK